MRSLAGIKRGWGKFGVDFDDLGTDCSGGKTIFDCTTSVCTETCAQFPIIGECFDGVGECGGVIDRNEKGVFAMPGDFPATWNIGGNDRASEGRRFEQ